MSVSINSAPLQQPLFNSAGGNGACLRWCIQESALEILAGARAVYTLTVTGAGVSGNVRIAGKTFTVNNLISDYNSSQFNADSGDAIITATNLLNAVKSNIDIYPYYTFSLTPSGPNYILTVQAKEIGYIAPTPFDAGTIGWAYTFTQGTPLLLKEGYKYAYQLIMIEPDGTEVECMDIQTVKPRYDYEGGAEVAVCFDLVNIAANYVKTYFPSSQPDEYLWDPTAVRKFYIRFGYVDRVGCTTLESGFRNDYAIWLVNHAASVTEKNGPVDYAPDPFSGVPQFKKLMTSRSGVRIPLCSDTYAWIYGFYNGVIGTGNVHLAVRYFFYDCNGDQIAWLYHDDPFTGKPNGYDTYNTDSNGVFIIPIGGANKPLAWPAGTAKVVVIVGKIVNDDSVNGFFQQYEEYVYYVSDNCDCNDVEAYFLCEAGGYDTILFERFQEIGLTTEQSQVTFRDFCRDFQDNVPNWQEYLSETGRDQYKTIARRRFKVSTRKFPNDETHKRFIEQFITSEHRMVRVHYSATEFLAQKINIVHSDFIIEKEKGFARYELTFEFAHSLTPVKER